MRKKLLSALLAGVMVISLAACGSGGAPGSGGSAGGSGTQNPSPSTSGEKVTINLWHYFPDAYAPVFQAQIDEYNKSQDHIEVVLTFVSREDLMKQYAMGSISGELPDIGMTDSPDMASFIEMGVFEDITDLANDWGELDQFLKGPLSSCYGSDGRLYGLPQNSNCLGYIYNKTALEELGITEIPKTWDELEALCKTVADSGKDCYGFGLSANSSEVATFQFYPLLYSAGGSMETINSPESVKALTFLSDLYKAGYISPEAINWTGTNVMESFIAGKTLTMINGPWTIPTLEQSGLDFEYGVAEIPIDQVKASVIGGENLGICAGTEHKEEAFEVLKYVMGAQTNADYAEAAGRFPVRGDGMELKTVWTEDPIYSEFAKMMDYAVARGPHPEWSTISEAIYSNTQAALLGEKTPQEALDAAAAIITPLLAK